VNILEQVMLDSHETFKAIKKGYRANPYQEANVSVQKAQLRKVVEWLTDDYKEQNFNVMVSRLNQLAAALKEVEG
jgi:hypothetical protein